MSTSNDHFVALVESPRNDFAERWNAILRHGAATAFQTGCWLEAWYSTIGRALGDPILVTVLDRRTDSLAAVLPLVRRTDRHLRIIEFADCGVSDNNAPVLGPATPVDPEGAKSLWKALHDTLTEADLVRFTKMPADVEGRVNPLVLLPSTHPSPLASHIVTIDCEWNDYWRDLHRTFRNQLARHWRAFSSQNGAACRYIEAGPEAAKILGQLEHQQSARIRRLGKPYTLDQPEFAAFYRKLTADGLPRADVVLTALTRHDEVVSALLGVTRGATYTMIRVSIGSDEWLRYSPGCLLIARTMQMLHERGYRHFDLSIGNDHYKRRFGGQRRPLFDMTAALSPQGLPLVAYDRIKGFIRAHPRLYALARRAKRSGLAEGKVSRAD